MTAGAAFFFLLRFLVAFFFLGDLFFAAFFRTAFRLVDFFAVDFFFRAVIPRPLAAYSSRRQQRDRMGNLLSDQPSSQGAKLDEQDARLKQIMGGA